MKIRSLLFLSLFVFASACTQAEVETPVEQEIMEEGELSAAVILAEEDYEVFPLSANFKSDQETFDYSFAYDGNLLKLVSFKFDGASDFGPSFMAEGGVEVVGSTLPLAQLSEVQTLAAVTAIGDHEVRLYTDAEGECSVRAGYVTHQGEAVLLKARTCGDDNPQVADYALRSLFKGLSFAAL